jgi:lysophospholipase L1-like esterase
VTWKQVLVRTKVQRAANLFRIALQNQGESFMMRSVSSLIGVTFWCLITPLTAQPAATPQTSQTAVQPKQAPFESEIAAFESEDKQSPPPSGAVLFLGSSSIRLWTTLPKDFPELTVINRGFGGSEIADSVRYAPRIVLPYKPKTIVFYAGGNDINSGKAPETVLKNYQAFVREVHKALPTTRIVYISMNPAVSRWKKEPQFVVANRLIEEYVRKATKKGMPLNYLDSHSKLLSATGEARPEIYRADGLHLNSKGYELWTAILRPQIMALAAMENGAHKAP